jgi:hypothetical protein
VTDRVGEAIEGLIAREDADGMRRTILARIDIERTDLELTIRAPWLDPVERRAHAVDAVRRAWSVDL